MMDAHLHSLPPEILLKALALSEPQAVSNWSQTCRAAHEFSASPVLWKALFFANYDHVSTSTTPSSIDYELAVKERTRARSWLKDERTVSTLKRSSGDLKRTLQALVEVAEQRAPSEVEQSLNAQFLEDDLGRVTDLFFIDGGSDFSKGYRLRSQGGAEAQDTIQLAARLHVLHTPTPLSLSSEEIRTQAREVVYERDNFLVDCRYGPFKPLSSSTKREPFFKTGTGNKLEVDWKKLESLAIVQGWNLREAMDSGWSRGGADEEETALPKGWDSTRPGLKKESYGRDWAGVEDAKLGTYAFLDYRSFAHYNFHRTPTMRPSLDDESEAVGDCMKLDLKLLPEGEEVRPLDVDMARSMFMNGNGGESEEEDDDFEMTEDEGSEEGNGEGAESQSDSEESESDESEMSDSGFHPIASVQQRLDQEMDATGEEEISPPTSEMGSLPNASPSTSLSPPIIPKPSSPSTSKLHFLGTSQPLHFSGTFMNQRMPNRSIRGTVEMTEEGQVHWQYVIRYGGSDQWKMHGVQVGGARSKFGILGVWSTADHDEAGPNGPFWYWPQNSK